ncbi:MAG: asparaginase [Flavobacteriales bacterium]|jgi:L-asparaginase|nr:asparaginase [Flavobacteriales bacterium]
MSKQRNILLVYTGGTIGMMKDPKTGALRAFNFDKLLKNIPELNLLDCKISTQSFAKPIDSSDMNTEYYIDLVEIIEQNYDDFDGFVVLSGSDTMAYASSAISFMLENLSKPVIFTGSQLPIGDLRTDAKENLITAIQIAASYINDIPTVPEVALYFEYQLYRANRTTKINAEHFEAFTSLNYPPLATSGVHLKFNKEAIMPYNKKVLIVRKILDTNIAILKLFPGITKTTISSTLNIKNIKGIIIETYGSGNAPTSIWFIELLKKAIKKGIFIINVTQCSGGSVTLGQYDTSMQLKKIGIIDGKDITTESAVGKCMYLLGAKISSKDFKSVFETSLRGEIV